MYQLHIIQKKEIYCMHTENGAFNFHITFYKWLFFDIVLPNIKYIITQQKQYDDLKKRIYKVSTFLQHMFFHSSADQVGKVHTFCFCELSITLPKHNFVQKPRKYIGNGYFYTNVDKGIYRLSLGCSTNEFRQTYNRAATLFKSINQSIHSSCTLECWWVQ